MFRRAVCWVGFLRLLFTLIVCLLDEILGAPWFDVLLELICSLKTCGCCFLL